MVDPSIVDEERAVRSGHPTALAFWRPLGASVANSMAIQAIGIATGVVLARSLGPSDRGALAAVLLWPAMYGTLGLLGVGDAVTYAIVRRADSARAVASTALAVVVVQSVLLVGLGAGLTPLILGHYGGRVVFWGLIAMAQIPVTLAAQMWASVINGLHRYALFQLVRISFIVLSAAGILVLGAIGELSVGTAVVTYISANIVSAAFIAGLVRRAGALGIRPDRATARGLLAYGLKSHVGVLSSALNQRLDQLVISVVLAPSQLGVYVVAVAVAGSVTTFGSSFALQALPMVGRPAALAEVRTRVRRLFVVTTILSLAAAGTLAAVAHPLISVFFGSSFAGAVTPARILVLAGVFLGTGTVMGSVLRALGRPLHAGLGDLLALGVTAVALAALIPPLGLNGAALASLAAYATSSLWLVRRAAKELDLPLHAFVVTPRRLWAAVAALAQRRVNGNRDSA